MKLNFNLQPWLEEKEEETYNEYLWVTGQKYNQKPKINRRMHSPGRDKITFYLQKYIHILANGCDTASAEESYSIPQF